MTISALLITGELFDFAGFISRHPFVLWDLTTFSIASALGQVIHIWSISTMQK
jgi:hypothetical protein